MTPGAPLPPSKSIKAGGPHPPYGSFTTAEVLGRWPGGTAGTRKEQNVTRTTRVASANRPRSRVVVVLRSFLDAGTEVLIGERKFLDYAFPPTHTPMDVVTNTGGRVGWHNSPLPGPFFPW
jgi:hypothetical protein